MGGWTIPADNSREAAALAAYGLKAWTYNPNLIANAFAPATQKILFTSVTLRAGDIATNMLTSVQQGAAGTNPTTIKLGLYAADGSSRLAVTGNLNADAKWTSVGFKSFAFAAPFTVTTTGIYLAAFLSDGVFGTTVLQLHQIAGNAGPGSALNGAWPAGTGGTGQTDLGTTITPATSGGTVWFGIS